MDSNQPPLSALLHSSELDYSDIFNTDMFSNSQSPHSTRSSPAPATPYDPFAEQSMFTSGASSSGASEFFNFMYNNESAAKNPATDPFGLSNFDFAGALHAISPGSPSGTIDPASILGTPSSLTLDDFEAHEAMEEPAVIPPLKAGGHGKGARKGTVQNGGVTKSRAAKKASPTPAAVATPAPPAIAPTPTLTAKQEHGDDDDLPADWRPPPEVFAKMTSKEKRQLRNKISARNFRTRRKEYITTLEGDIADRDKLLAAIRAELGTSQTENKALRAEIAALKRALLTGHPPSPSLLSSNVPAAPPSPAPTSSPEPGTKQQHTPPSSPLLMPNFAKDLPMAGPSTKPFWAGAGPAGFTPVHRTVLPEVNLERAFHSQRDGENINPMMNLRPQIQETFEKKPTFDQWSENHLFNLKNLDAYRMQLWQQMALRQQQQNQQPHLTGLAGSIRPHFFLGGLSARQQLLTPPSSPPVGGFKKLSTPSSSSPAPPSDAVLATLASQTLVRRLGSAFWDAFSGKEDGVKKLLEGKVKLELVDIEGPSVRPPTPARAVTLPTSRPTSAQPIAPVARPSEDGCMARILEESMRGLSLAGKK